MNAQDIVDQPALYIALELGSKDWIIVFGTRRDRKVRHRRVQAGDLEALTKQIEQARRAYQLPEESPVYSCYEAGRDGFWLHRFLVFCGVRNLVVDSASVEVSQRRRRVKTDRLDAKSLLRKLIRYHEGEDESFSFVRVPSESEEDERRIQREIQELKGERTRYMNRIQAMLNLKGIRVQRIDNTLSERLPELVGPGGHRLQPHEQEEIGRKLELLKLVNDQIRSIHHKRCRRVREEDSSQMHQIRALLRLRGIGMESAWLFVTEMFGWREFSNRREVGAFSGLAPTPYSSDQTVREQGISKAGSERIRAMAIEVAWKWVEFQPRSELTQWFQRRCGDAGSRVRRNGITALARKLLVSLWKYLEWGEVPAGAELKASPPA